jgi:neutral ceramidase
MRRVCGLAKVDITPATPEIMWGFEDRLTPAASTLDPLYARVLILEAGQKRLGIVTLDLGRSFGPASVERLKASARRTSGISCLLLAASHTHSAPVIRDENPNGPPEWERVALDKIEHAIEQAGKQLVDAKIGTGVGTTDIGHNRLKVNADDLVTWFERNPEREPTKPVDQTVTVIRVDSLNGIPMAVLVHYACHPVVLGSDNQQYSADFPGVMNRVVEMEMDDKPMSFFIQGAPGDINPYYAVTRVDQDGVKWRDWTGERLGKEAARVAKNIHPAASKEASIDSIEESMKFRLRWNPERFKAALVKFLGPKGIELYGAPVSPEFEVPTATVLINKQIAIATVPGEPFVDFQMNWRERCPVGPAILMGYTNGYHGYFPTIRAAGRNGYGAASASTWVEVGAGERLLDSAVVNVYQMLGRFSDLPDDLKRDVYK